jgi:hypothetical protein
MLQGLAVANYREPKKDEGYFVRYRVEITYAHLTSLYTVFIIILHDLVDSLI